MTTSDAPFDVEAVLRRWGFEPVIEQQIGACTVTVTAILWEGVLDGREVSVPLAAVRSFAHQLLMRN